MAVDYSVLFQGPTIGQRITQAQEANRLREESDVRNQLSRMQLEDARRKMEEDEYMNRLLARPEAVTPSGINYDLLTQQAQTEGRGRMVPKLLAARGVQEEATGKREKERLERLKNKFSLVPELYKQAINSTDPGAAMLGVHEFMHRDDDLGAFLKSAGAAPEKGRATIEAAIAQGPDAVRDLMLRSISSVEQLSERFNPKPTVVAPSASVYDPRKGTFTQAPAAPEKPEASPADVKAYEYARNQGYTGSFMDFKAAQRPPGTKVDVTVSTGKKYGETFGTQIAERDANMLDAARQAPTLASDANRILDLANNPNVFTGSLAQVKLNVARALGVVGADTNEVVANTEQLIAAAGQSTLNAIKGAGLGTGQGFTDKDLAFLRDIAGGKITFTKETLSELARLQYKVAEKAAGAWGSRVKEIPKEALEGTGISTAPITLPPLSRPGGPPKAVGQIPGQAPAAKTVVRTGTLNGRKVVQYSDGTTGYAD